ncbi:MAG: hypothetical protein KDD83_02395, partial [Caldilineaceae bacterium]|nr:hypothetical protein [Caldilineaceae bacterium]
MAQNAWMSSTHGRLHQSSSGWAIPVAATAPVVGTLVLAVMLLLAAVSPAIAQAGADNQPQSGQSAQGPAVVEAA